MGTRRRARRSGCCCAAGGSMLRRWWRRRSPPGTCRRIRSTCCSPPGTGRDERCSPATRRRSSNRLVNCGSVSCTRRSTYWRHRADAEVDPDGPEPQLPTPSLTLTPIDGAVAINGELDPVGGQIVVQRLGRRSPTSSPSSIPSSTGSSCARWRWSRWPAAPMAVPPGAKPARILANIACGEGAFAQLCELANGTIIRPGHLVAYLGALDIRSIVYDAANRAVAVSCRGARSSGRCAPSSRSATCTASTPSGCDEPIDALRRRPHHPRVPRRR